LALALPSSILVDVEHAHHDLQPPTPASMSQREAYQFPSSTSGQIYGYDAAATPAPKVAYICGDCAAKVYLDKEDKIRCSQCGHRVLYKERTKRRAQADIKSRLR